MIFLVLYIFGIICALGLGVLASLSDLKGMVIPNYISAIVVMAFIFSYTGAALGGVEIFSSLRVHLLCGGIFFIVTFIMFAMKIIGGGDAKLASAFSFWMGAHESLMAYMFYMAIGGAALAVVAVFLKKVKPLNIKNEKSWVSRVQNGESVVPYGLPIAFGAFAGLKEGGFLSYELFFLF